MFNASEIHHLVGLLTQVSQPEAVEIILGEMIYNEASKTKRDLDVTIKYKDNNGEQYIFMGLEVKAHGRPLDTAQVEQLCAKLNTHNAVKSRGIISSSGYTQPAIETAKYHKIDLYNLEDWDIDKIKFDHVVMTEDFRFIENGKETGKPVFKLLTKQGDQTFRVGCALTELSVGNLIGMTVSHADRTVRLINIPQINRSKNKIYNIKLK
jgi:hypothetical protein